MKIIAELCQNHNGSFRNLLEMVDTARKNGADFAKIQAIYSSELVFRKQFENSFSKENRIQRPFQIEFERLKKLDLTQDQEKEFVQYCLKSGITPMITVFTLSGVHRAKNAGFKHFKIASYDSTNLALIRAVLPVAEFLCISTGATTENELRYLVSHLKSLDIKCEITLLHCKTEYPTSLNSVNLKRMVNLSSFGYSIGYSDHTEVYDESGNVLDTRNFAAFCAINFGATIIERHFSILKPEETKDGRISINAEDLRELKKFSKMDNNDKRSYLHRLGFNIDLVMGEGNFEPSIQEWTNRSYYKGRFST